MDDLRLRFTTFDKVPAPDLWPDIERRADAAATRPSLRPIDVDRPTWAKGGADGVRAGRPARLALAAVLIVILLAALLVGAFVAGTLRIDDRHATVISPSAPPSGFPSATPTNASPAAGCVQGGPPNALRATKIGLPAHIADIALTNCSLWLQSEKNNGGISRLDLATNAVVATVVPAEVVLAIGTTGDQVWAIARKAVLVEPERPSLVRIDPATNSVAETIPLSLQASGMAVVGHQAWLIGWDPNGPTGPRAIVQVLDLDSHRVLATVPVAMGHLGPRILAVAAGSLWIRGGMQTAHELWRVDLLTHAVASVATPVGADCVPTGGGLYCATDRGDLLQLSTDTGQVLRVIGLGTASDAGAALAASGTEVWVMPMHLVPDGAGFRTVSTELLRVDAPTAAITARYSFPLQQPIAIMAGGGSVWISTAADPLIRIDLPAQP